MYVYIYIAHVTYSEGERSLSFLRALIIAAWILGNAEFTFDFRLYLRTSMRLDSFSSEPFNAK